MTPPFPPLTVPHTVNLTLLNATLTKFSPNAANKGLTNTISPLEATFTSFVGWPFNTTSLGFSRLTSHGSRPYES